MSMQSVLLTAALHYILSPSSLSPVSPLSPPAAGMLSPSPPNPISLLLSFQYNLSLLSPLRFLMQHGHGANMWSSSSPLLTPPHPPTLCRVLPPSIPILCLLSCLRGLARVCGPQLPTEPPSLPLLSLSSLLSLSLCVSFSLTESPPPFASPTSLLPFLLFCGLSAFPCLFPLPRSRCLKTFQACLIIFLHVAGFVSMCVSAFSSGCLRKHKPFFQNVSFTVRGRRTHI